MHPSISTTNLEAASATLWDVLSRKLTYLSRADVDTIHLAFLLMVEAHGEQRRKSGDFYITHPVEACMILADIGLDRDTLAACLLHDVPEDTHVGLDQINKAFGPQITFLVSGVTKLSSVKYKGDDRYCENLRRMFVAMSKDLRVIFIKLADRIHNLRTLEHVKPEKARRIALESLEIYAPIAERLGIGYLKGEIEDLVFPFLYPDAYNSFITDSSILIEQRQQQVNIVKTELETVLENNNVHYIKLSGRAKRYYSLYKKMIEHDSLASVYDMVALRIIVPGVDDCYAALSVVQQAFTPIEGRVKDYIRAPKPNGYQSLHTTVKDNRGYIFEVQIRTQDMHEFAEYGVAAHWSYKQRVSNIQTRFLNPDSLKWISELVDIGKRDISEEEYLRMVKLDLFNDRIFVLTPKSDVIELPAGATVLDFAFRIHESIGSRATMAKVNGMPVKLMHTLQNGDMCEIITSKMQRPKQDWLTYVTTTNASKKIRTLLRKQTEEYR